MVSPETSTCLHCERQPPANGLGLCPACSAVKGIRYLYVRRRGWTPQWELRLRQLTERAKLRLPLFPASEDVRGGP